MKNYTTKRYQKSDYELWNSFVTTAKNATFLFQRDFMEYHKTRFEDFSLLVFDETKLVAILPANIVENKVYSHQGLTYGGLVFSDKIKMVAVINIFKSILSFLNAAQIEKLQLKLLPSIYHQKPAEEMEYALFLVKAQLFRRDALSVLRGDEKKKYSKLRKRSLKKGISQSFVIKEFPGFEAFWNEILIPNLDQKYQTQPVHSLPEISLLKQRFPEQIRQFNVYLGETIMAGTTIFESDYVAHCQYISGKESCNNLGGLEVLFHHLLTDVFKNKRFFDFGISNENEGQNLNSGLSYWKESFGASTIVHDFYEVATSNFVLLDQVIV